MRRELRALAARIFPNAIPGYFRFREIIQSER